QGEGAGQGLWERRLAQRIDQADTAARQPEVVVQTTPLLRGLPDQLKRILVRAEHAHQTRQLASSRWTLAVFAYGNVRLLTGQHQQLMVAHIEHPGGEGKLLG